MRHHFLATTEGSLPITALYYGFEIPEPLVLDAKNDLALEGDVYPEFFSCFLEDMVLLAGIFPVFWEFFRIPMVCFDNRYLLTGIV